MPNRCVITVNNVTDQQMQQYKQDIIDDYLFKEELVQKTGNGMFMIIVRTPMFNYGVTEVFKEVFNENQFNIISLKPIKEEENASV